MARLFIILLVGLVCEAIGVVLLSRGIKEITGWLLTPEELTDPRQLAARLTQHAEPLSQRLWLSLAPNEQGLLADPAVEPKLKSEVMLRMLNRQIEEGPVYDPALYPNISWSAETRKRLGQAVQANDQIELRRLLLQDAYPGEISKQADRKVGVPEVLKLVGRGVTNVHILLGVFFEALFFVGLLMLISKADVSFVWPLTSLSFVVTTIAAKVYLHEEVSALRWSGVCLIMIGAGLISWTEKQHRDNASAVPVAASGPARSLSTSQ